jgi:hypothetical protein
MPQKLKKKTTPPTKSPEELKNEASKNEILQFMKLLEKSGVDPYTMVNQETMKFNIADKRKIRATTGKPMEDNRDKKEGDYHVGTVYKLIKAAKSAGINPYTAVAVGLAETRLGSTDENVGHVTGDQWKEGDLMDTTVEEGLAITLKKKMEYAKKLGFTSPELQLQAYNGLGKVFPSTEADYHGYQMKSIYGVPLDKNGIDMKKNPLYGKEVLDLQNNVIKQNPLINGMVKAMYLDEKIPEFSEGGTVKDKKTFIPKGYKEAKGKARPLTKEEEKEIEVEKLREKKANEQRLNAVNLKADNTTQNTRKREEISDSIIENIAEMIDPTGILSYDDVKRGWADNKFTSDDVKNMIGALPMTGLLGKFGRVSTGIKKADRSLKMLSMLPDALNVTEGLSDIIEDNGRELSEVSLEKTISGLDKQYEKGFQQLEQYAMGGKIKKKLPKFDVGGIAGLASRYTKEQLAKMHPEQLEMYSAMHNAGGQLVSRTMEPLTPEELQQDGLLKPNYNFSNDFVGQGASPQANMDDVIMTGGPNIKGEPAPLTASDAALTKDEASKPKQGGSNAKIGMNISTAPLIAGANALVTNFVYNPQLKRREMEMMRNQIAPIQSPGNFNGNDDMEMYAKGGMVVSYDDPEGVMSQPIRRQPTQMNPISMYKTSGRPAPRMPQPIPVPQTSVPGSIEFEQLLDENGSPVGYNPIFHGNYSPSQIRDTLPNLPKEFGGVPVVRSFNEYREMNQYQPKTNKWTQPSDPSLVIKPMRGKSGMVASSFANGGEVDEQFEVSPLTANAEVEGGEFMQTPHGQTDMIDGKSHAEGGEPRNYPDGTRIFSKKLKADKEVASTIMGKNITKKMPISKLAAKFDTKKEDEILKNTTSDKIAMDTAKLMKGHKEAKLDQLFQYQEAMKGPVVDPEMMAQGGSVGNKILKGVGNVTSQLGEMMPEMVGMIQAMTDSPIWTQKFQPTYMPQAPQLNIEGQLAKNYSQVKPFLDSNSGNASVDSARALQALASVQDANNQVYQQKYNVDTRSKQMVDQSNVQIKNQADLENYKRMSDFSDKSNMRQFNKETAINQIAQSTYEKSKGKQLEQRSQQLINQMYNNYQYDPETGMSFIPGQGAAFRSSSKYMTGNNGFDPNDNAQTTYTEIIDSKGNKKYVKRLRES